MRRILGLIAITAAVLFGVPASSSADVTYELGYQCEAGNSGQFWILGGAGRQYVVRDQSMTVIASGVAQNGSWVVPVTVTQPGGLWVTIDGQAMVFLDHRDAWWM